MDLKKLAEFVALQNALRKQAHENKELGFDWALGDFINLMRTLNPANYGTRIQNRIIQNLKFEKLKANQNKGDCLNNFGDAYEIKTSIIDGINIDLNVVNIREWQPVNYYIVAFDVRPEVGFKCYFFCLSKFEMLEELKILITSNALGTIESNATNENVERRFSIRIDSDNWNRWCFRYLSNAGKII